MQISLYHNHYSKTHLDQVKQKMQVLGPPTIRAIWSATYGMWMAIEGCHRLRAAKDLGVTPIISDVSGQQTVNIQCDGRTKRIKVSALLEDLEADCWRREYISYPNPTGGVTPA